MNLHLRGGWSILSLLQVKLLTNALFKRETGVLSQSAAYSYILFRRHIGRGRANNPTISAIMNNTMNKKNRNLAMVIETDSTPVNPKIAAIIAMIRNINAHLSIWTSFQE